MSIELLILAVILAIPYSILKSQEDARKLEEAKKRQRVRDEENARIHMKSYMRRCARGLFYDDPLKPYCSITVELNYMALTESEKRNGYIHPESPNYNDENKAEYEEKLRRLKWREDFYANEWKRKLK